MSKKIAWLVRAGGELGKVEEVKPENGKTFKLEELQGFVGGRVERIELPNNKEIWLNEEGKLNGLPVNDAMTVL